MSPSLVIFVIAVSGCILPSLVCQRTCSECFKCQSSPTQDTALCKCDANCTTFGDCCRNHDPSCPALAPPTPLPASNTVSPTCTSIFLDPNVQIAAENETFLMVSSCPASWEDGGVAELCTNRASRLPPVTDTATGQVYRNEYCARCCGARTLMAWRINLVCNSTFYELVLSQGFDAVLNQDPGIIQRECTACSYRAPVLNDTDVPSPRSCAPATSQCMERATLELASRQYLTTKSYAEMVRNCTLGSQDLVVGGEGVVYRNTACATCNGKRVVQCLQLETTRSLTLGQCFPGNPSTTTTYTTTSTTTAETTPIVTTRPTVGPNTEYPLKPRLPGVLPDLSTTSPTRRPTKPTHRPTKPTRRPITPPGHPTRPVPSPRAITSDIIVEPSSNIEFAFTITLSGLGDSHVFISSDYGSTDLNLDCPDGQVPVGLECTPTQCPEGYSETGGRCSYVVTRPSKGDPSTNDTPTGNCSTPLQPLNETNYIVLSNDTVLLEDSGVIATVVDYDQLGRPLICVGNVSDSNSTSTEFLDCPSQYVALNQSDYTEFDNNTIFYNNKTIEVEFYDESGRPFICPDNHTTTPQVTVHTSPLSVLPGIVELTYIGCSLSSLGTVLLLVTYTLFKELRTLPGLILMNLSTTILATSLIFIVGGPVLQYHPVKQICTAVAILLHFFYLAQFTWMVILSWEMVRTFYKAKKMMIGESKSIKTKLSIAYTCIGWGLPLMILIVTVALNFATETLVLYGEKRDGSIMCWINHLESLIATFVVPLALCLSINAVMFVVTTVLLCKASKGQSRMNKSNNAALVRVWLANFSTTGLTWVFGFAAITNETSWFWYPFIIFSSTQGLALSLVFIFTKKILARYHNFFKCQKKQQSRSSSSGEQRKMKKCASNTTSKTSMISLDQIGTDANYA